MAARRHRRQVADSVEGCARPAGASRGVDSPLTLLSAFVFPVRRDIRAGFCQVNVLVDVVDPGDRYEVVMVTIRRALLGQLDLVGSV